MKLLRFCFAIFQQTVSNPFVINGSLVCETLNQFLKSGITCFHLKVYGLYR